MLRSLRFSLQNAIYFIMLPFLVTVLFIFYIQGVLLRSHGYRLEMPQDITFFPCWRRCSRTLYKSVHCCCGNAIVCSFCAVVELQNVFVLLLTIISIKYYDCLYSCLIYPACKSHSFCATFCSHLWPVWRYHTFAHYPINP